MWLRRATFCLSVGEDSARKPNTVPCDWEPEATDSPVPAQLWKGDHCPVYACPHHTDPWGQHGAHYGQWQRPRGPGQPALHGTQQCH